MDGYLSLTIHDSGRRLGFKEGDVIAAVNHRSLRTLALMERLRAKDPETRRPARLNKNGFIPLKDPYRDYLEAASQYRIERLGYYRLRKVRLSDGAAIEFDHNKTRVDPFDNEPQANINILALYDRKISTWLENNSRGVPLFGRDALSVVFYCGIEDRSNASLNAGWKACERKLGIAESTVDMKPRFSDLTDRLILRVDDFPDQVASNLITPLVEYSTGDDGKDNVAPVRKRKHKVDWRQLSDIDIAKTLDRRKRIEVDELQKRTRSGVVLAKSVEEEKRLG